MFEFGSLHTVTASIVAAACNSATGCPYSKAGKGQNKAKQRQQWKIHWTARKKGFLSKFCCQYAAQFYNLSYFVFIG
jgi:hypothetical protein